MERNPDSYVVVDLETTGLQPAKDRILEIGAVKVENGEVKDTFCTFINPRMAIPPFIQALTGITQDMVENAPTAISFSFLCISDIKQLKYLLTVQLQRQLRSLPIEILR